MTANDAHDRLVESFAALAGLAAEHRLLCAADEPDQVALTSVRWKIAGAGRQRMELLADTIFPLLERCCTGHELAIVSQFRTSETEYRRSVSTYVARWSTAEIMADWKSYQREAQTFRRHVEARIGREKKLLLPILRRLTLIRTTPPSTDGGRAAGFAHP